MVHIAIWTLSAIANALNSKKKLKYCENQHHLHICQIVDILNSINVNFLQFCVKKYEMMYTNMPRQIYLFSNFLEKIG